MEFHIPTQVMFRPYYEDDEYYFGIAYQNMIICGCCGGVFELDGVVEVYPYKEWADISDAISDSRIPGRSSKGI